MGNTNVKTFFQDPVFNFLCAICGTKSVCIHEIFFFNSDYEINKIKNEIVAVYSMCYKSNENKNG